VRKTAWEAEKKMRRRIEVLEKRLEDKGHELEAAEGQAQQARDLLQRATKEKEGLQKRLSALTKDTNEVRGNESDPKGMA